MPDQSHLFWPRAYCSDHSKKCLGAWCLDAQYHCRGSVWVRARSSGLWPRHALRTIYPRCEPTGSCIGYRDEQALSLCKSTCWGWTPQRRKARCRVTGMLTWPSSRSQHFPSATFCTLTLEWLWWRHGSVIVCVHPSRRGCKSPRSSTL